MFVGMYEVLCVCLVCVGFLFLFFFSKPYSCSIFAYISLLTNYILLLLLLSMFNLLKYFSLRFCFYFL